MGAGQPKALVPQDLQGLRGQNIQLLQQLLGFPSSPQGSSGRGASGIPDIFRQLQGGGAPGGPPGTLGGGDPLGRLQSFFGSLGSPQSTLQMQGADAIGTMLRQPTPEQRALDISLPALQSMLTGTGPQFERDLALGNQQGGRFGSANAILRGEAFKNLYNMRDQVAQTLGLLSQGAGQANRGLAGQAFGTGQAQAQQGDIETQRRLQILMQLLGVGQSASFNVPIQQGQSFIQQLMGIAAPIAGYALGGPAGGAAGGALAGQFGPSNFPTPGGYGAMGR